MKVEGACHCGQITFEAQVDPKGVNVCHCSDCQALSGSPYRTSIISQAADFVLKSGTPKTYIKTAESGNRRVHAFCGDCGSPVYATAISNPTSYTLRVGTLKQRHELMPGKQIWTRSALAQFKDLSTVPEHERGPTA